MTDEKTGATYIDDGAVKDVTAGDLKDLAVKGEDMVLAAAETARKAKPKRPPFERRELFDALYKQADTLRVLVDGAAYGVVLPEALSIHKRIAIHFKGALKQPRDVSTDEWGVRAMVYFPDPVGEHVIALPWDAVVEVTDMDKFVWQDRRQMRYFEEMNKQKLPPKYTKKGKAARRHLRVVR